MSEPATIMVRTQQSVLGQVLVQVLDVAAWLEGATVGVEIKVSHRLLDAHTEPHVLLGEGVDGVHKVGIVR